jgi:hypothetical protein
MRQMRGREPLRAQGVGNAIPPGKKADAGNNEGHRQRIWFIISQLNGYTKE